VKDIAAGAVGVSILAWLIAIVIETGRLWRHLS
jgi:hypothetical protein